MPPRSSPPTPFSPPPPTCPGLGPSFFSSLFEILPDLPPGLIIRARTPTKRAASSRLFVLVRAIRGRSFPFSQRFHSGSTGALSPHAGIQFGHDDRLDAHFLLVRQLE